MLRQQFLSRNRHDIQRHIEVSIGQARSDAGAQARRILRYGGKDHGHHEDAALPAAAGEGKGRSLIRHPHGHDGRLAGEGVETQALQSLPPVARIPVQVFHDPGFRFQHIERGDGGSGARWRQRPAEKIAPRMMPEVINDVRPPGGVIRRLICIFGAIRATMPGRTSAWQDQVVG